MTTTVDIHVIYDVNFFGSGRVGTGKSISFSWLKESYIITNKLQWNLKAMNSLRQASQQQFQFTLPIFHFYILAIITTIRCTKKPLTNSIFVSFMMFSWIILKFLSNAAKCCIVHGQNFLGEQCYDFNPFQTARVVFASHETMLVFLYGPTQLSP